MVSTAFAWFPFPCMVTLRKPWTMPTLSGMLREESILLAGDELLPAVDVVGRACEGRVGHDVNGERGDVVRSDDAPDGKRGAKLIATLFEFIAEQRCRQRCVDEAGGDDVDPHGRDLRARGWRRGRAVQR